MVQTNDQYEFVHYAVSMFDQQRLTASIPLAIPFSSPSFSSSSSGSTPTHDDDICDLK